MLTLGVSAWAKAFYTASVRTSTPIRGWGFWNTAAAQRAAGGSDGEFGATRLARGHNRRAVEAAGFNDVILDSSFCPKTPSSVMPPRTAVHEAPDEEQPHLLSACTPLLAGLPDVPFG